MTRILGLGHSHVVAIAKGCYELQNQRFEIGGEPITSRFLYLYDPKIMPTLVDEGGRQRLNPALVEIIAKEDPRFILLSVGGNEHIAMSVVRFSERIDFLLGDEPDLLLEPGAEILTEAAIRETLRDKMAPTLSTLRAIREATRLPLVCLEPPPPLPNERIIAFPKEFFKRAIDPDRLSSELFRYKMWRVQSWLYRETCAKCDMLFVPVPQEFLAPPGLLARDAWGEDASHANALFGRRMIALAGEALLARGLIGA
jgi:hypothetical protein